MAFNFEFPTERKQARVRTQSFDAPVTDLKADFTESAGSSDNFETISQCSITTMMDKL